MKRRRFLLSTFAFLAIAGSAWASGITGGTTTTTGIDARLESAVTVVADEATRMGDAAFAERFATEFGVTADVLLQQRTQFEADWGELLVAHSIAGTSRTGVTVDQIFGMRSDGRSWTEIARSLRVGPGRLVKSVRTRIETFDTEGGSASGKGAAAGRTRATERIDGRIESGLASFEEQAMRLDDQAIAERLGAELGVEASVLLDQRTQFGADWGDLVIAYTVADKAKTSVTVDEVFAMRASGESWGEIATALRVPAGRLLSGLKTETKSLTRTAARSGGGTGVCETGKGGSMKGAARAAVKGGAHAATKAALRGAGARATVSATTRASAAATLTASKGSLMRAAARGGIAAHGKK